METAGFQSLLVKDVVTETADAASLVFDVTPGLFAYKAGQFLTLRLTIDGQPVLRCYSMSSAPLPGEDFRITVKRVARGLASNWLLDRVRPGDQILARPPSGTFVLGVEKRPLILFAGGSGITPVYAIVKAALAEGWPSIRLFYASQSPDAEIFRANLDRLVAAHPDRLQLRRHYDSIDGYPDAALLADFIGEAKNVEAYFCGPAPFMDNVEIALARRGIEPTQIHAERFVTPVETTALTMVDGTLTLECNGVAHVIPYQKDQPVLGAALAQKLPVAWSCGQGICGACIAEVVAGEVEMPQSDLLTEVERREGLVLMCQAKASGNNCRLKVI